MDKIVITGIPPYDGEYPFESNYSYAELHTIKRLAGVRGGELMDALESGDSDIIVAAAVIALERAGKNPDEADIWKATVGSIQLVGEPSTDPTTPPAPVEPNEGSGGDTTPSSDQPDNDQSSTGSPPSDAGASSDPETSGS